MKGLLIKDLLMFKMQKSSLLFFVVLVIFFSMFLGVEFIVQGYLTILMGILCLNSVSFDMMDHGKKMLLSLPISKKTYVWEKYLFGFLCFTLCCLISAGLALLIQKPSLIWVNVVGSSVGWVLIGIALGFTIVYGNEKGRLILFVLVFSAVGILGVLPSFLQASIRGWMDQLQSMSLALVGLGCLLISMVLYLGCGMIFSTLFERKELEL